MRKIVFFIPLVWVAVVFPAVPLCAEVKAILVTPGDKEIPTVRVFEETEELPKTTLNGALLFFPPQNGSPERWATFQDQDNLHPSRAIVQPTGAIADSIPSQTVQLEQLLAVTMNRSVPQYSTPTIFSPVDGGKNVQPKLTIRRLPTTNEKSGTKTFPVAVVRLSQGSETLFDIRFEEGCETLRWSDIPNLPERFRNGLSPGEYVLRVDGTTKENRFTVESSEFRDWMNGRFARIEALLGMDDPVAVQIEAEILAQDMVDGPFYSDALDRLTAVSNDRRTPYLEKLETFLLLRLTDGQGIVRGSDGRLEGDSREKAEESKAENDPVAAADLVHRLLLAEKWEIAAQRLQRLETMLDGATDLSAIKVRELIALVHLYRGMILAESGTARMTEGYAEFAQSLQLLDEIAAGGETDATAVALSRFRTANNFGNFLLRLVQDRLYNHAFSMAAGDGTVLTVALLTWTQAHGVYRQSQEIAERSLTDHPELAATAKINLARLYSLLGDLVRTVDTGKAADGIGDGAFTTAARLVQEALTMTFSGEERLAAVGHHLLADIAFRRGMFKQSREEALEARQCYVAGGTISGVEAIERLLGILPDETEQLRHLQIANELAEVLREQVPDEAVGLSRAGFLARRAYVNERIVSLLLREGRSVDALQVLEQSKARTLRDVLLGVGVRASDDTEISDLLADWPKEIVALEYFIGGEESHGFLIVDGKVESFPLVNAEGRPVPSREIVGSAVHFLSSCEFQARKMLVQSRRGFDPLWENELYRLRQILIPDPILAKIRTASPKKLLVVPQHVLHYFPFVALVTVPDAVERTKGEMKLPKFLLDEPFAVFCAPSLSSWRLLRQRDDAPVSRVTVVGISEFENAPPLDGVKKDLANVLAAFGTERVRPIVEKAATETAVREHFPERGMLMLATHGMNSPQSPLDGFLMLKSDERNDGSLSAAEIFSQSVGADLVVMSACYSGLADQSPMPGDDLFGLQRAFLHGGARTVVSGTWDVYDKTGPIIVADLMKNLAQGEDAPVALAEAQRIFLRTQREEGAGNPWVHPYFWAVYNITGDDRVHFERKTGP